MSMLHDNFIKSYTMDFEKGTLVLKTEYHGGEVFEKTDVIFTGYLAHVFYDEMIDNIIFDVEEITVEQFLERERETLEKRKNYSWPIRSETANALSEYLQTSGYRVFSVDSSSGLYGSVIAKQMDIAPEQIRN